MQVGREGGDRGLGFEVEEGEGVRREEDDEGRGWGRIGEDVKEGRGREGGEDV